MQNRCITINTENFQRISLQDAEKAQLMQRVDSKYIIRFEVCKAILEKVNYSYFIVDNNGYVIPEYISDYYDTPDFNMYLDHQNKRPKRYKIRVRNYRATGDSFLEIKIKVPSGKTIKKRIEAHSTELNQASVAEFIASKSPYIVSNLIKTLETRFDRLTLVAKDYNERITFDFNLALKLPQTEEKELFEEICIVEVKRSRQKSNSEISLLLKGMGIRPNSFSKYSIGCALLYPNIKHNNFKKTILYLNKLKNEHALYYNAIQ